MKKNNLKKILIIIIAFLIVAILLILFFPSKTEIETHDFVSKVKDIYAATIREEHRDETSIYAYHKCDSDDKTLALKSFDDTSISYMIYTNGKGKVGSITVWDGVYRYYYHVEDEDLLTFSEKNISYKNVSKASESELICYFTCSCDNETTKQK